MNYIAFLRAINVGGHNVKMDRLRELFTQLGFTDVRTYIQSGNVFFGSAEKNSDALRQQIEALLSAELGYEVPTVLRTMKQLAATLDNAPFKNTPPAEDERHLIVFTNQNLVINNLPAASPKGDCEVMGIHEKDAYVRWKIINGRPPSDAKFLKDTLGTVGTSRFYHTLIKMLAKEK